MDWYRDLYRRYGSRLRYLYASSTHDYLLSAYFNDITFKKYDTDDDVQAVFYHQLQDMVHSFKEMSPDSGIFINDWKNIAVIKPGLRGGTVHTAVRQLNFYTPSRSGVSMARWLSDAVSGVVYDVGAELL